MTIQEKKDKLLNIMDNYYILFKLINNDVDFKIEKEDHNVYDPWDWDNPYCYSIYIFNQYSNEYVKGSINLRDGECVLSIKYYFKEVLHTYLQKIYIKHNKDKIRTGHVWFRSPDRHEAELCFTDDNLFFEVLKTYMKLL